MAGDGATAVEEGAQEMLGGGTGEGEVGQEGAVAHEDDAAEAVALAQTDGVEAGLFFVGDLVI